MLAEWQDVLFFFDFRVMFILLISRYTVKKHILSIYIYYIDIVYRYTRMHAHWFKDNSEIPFRFQDSCKDEMIGNWKLHLNIRISASWSCACPAGFWWTLYNQSIQLNRQEQRFGSNHCFGCHKNWNSHQPFQHFDVFFCEIIKYL